MKVKSLAISLQRWKWIALSKTLSLFTYRYSIEWSFVFCV